MFIFSQCAAFKSFKNTFPTFITFPPFIIPTEMENTQD